MKRVISFLQIDKLVIVLLLSAMVFNMCKIEYWNEPREIIYWDVISYYGYLPATFIYKDLTLEFKDDYDGEHHFVIWANKAENGNYVFKTSMGLSYLYLPWFFLGHAIASNTDYDAGGYSVPYKVTMQFGVLFYLLIGLVFLRKVLRRYFSPMITALSMISVIVGTNLYYYIVFQGTVSHSYNFVLFSVFLWLVIKWHEKRNLRYTILIGLITGLITLVRPTNILVLILFVLWDVHSLKDVIDRLRVFLKEYRKVFLMILVFFVVWIPQLLYWKMITGSFFYYSYGDEGFFFLQPRIWKSLFSYRSGWLVYSPIMVFALIGFPFMLKYKTKEVFIPILVFTLINMWIIFSWWCWWWGGSFGLRPLTDSYAFLAIPFGSFVFFVFNQKKVWLKVLFVGVLLGFNFYGVHMTRKYYNKSIHYDGMNKELFWYNFWEIKKKDKFWSMIERPDYKKASLGLDEGKDEKHLFLQFQDERMKNLYIVKQYKYIVDDYLKGRQLTEVLFPKIKKDIEMPVVCTRYNNGGALETTYLQELKHNSVVEICKLDRSMFVNDSVFQVNFLFNSESGKDETNFLIIDINEQGNEKWIAYFDIDYYEAVMGWVYVSYTFRVSSKTKEIGMYFHHKNESNRPCYFGDFYVRRNKSL